jgi:Ca2+-binding EF-hand superfamily protein
MRYGEITLDELRAMAARAGLALADDELERLLPGVNRAKKQTVELRALIALETEPAAIFHPSDAGRKLSQ